ncbi:hypothetical protein BCV69DRAFT_283088 [Microstroma glucosiphilum]|uniref:Uncharacterized protein n=1 Tax=Pseudomicrostroma glucosiphilum TaxID=1684307 RepID=A0A316U4N6_9BASI|nr:hypothetical protein BCV69DRAFT_283088 [Pseudomicrostroma glucosiphilum]PWN20209.1 hypothetical protein BCV69DRAFT_283088 [Pseudomicrostroma glucosiphilum]
MALLQDRSRAESPAYDGNTSKDSDDSSLTLISSYDGEARFTSQMMEYSGSSSRSSRSSEDYDGEKSLLHRYRDQGSDSYSIDVGSGGSSFRSANKSSIKARARLQLRRLTRLMPRPIITVFILALVSLLGVSFTLKDQLSTSSLRDLQSQWRNGAKLLTGGTSFVGTESSSQTVASTHRAGLPRRPIPIQSHLEFLKDDGKYLEAWVARGEVLDGLSFSEHTKLDGLWNWVNGSDPRHSLGRAHFAQDPTRAVVPPTEVDAASSQVINGVISSLEARSHTSTVRKSLMASAADLRLQNLDSRFREHDELRYSLRSAKASLGKWLRTSHVVSTDFWPAGLPEGSDAQLSSRATKFSSRQARRDSLAISLGQSDVFHVEGGLTRYGQLPQWLDTNSTDVRVGDRARMIEAGAPPALRMHHDWSVFTPIQEVEPVSQALPSPPAEEDILAWKLRVLPTFNSMAAEAGLGLNVTDLSEIFFYTNDDNFMDAPMSTADFASPLYGPVFHINHVYPLQPIEHPKKELGEHPSLRFSAWLLGERFGPRTRHYIIHVQKAHVLPLVRESRLMWGAEFYKTTAKRFRGDGRATNSHLLSYNFIMERHREALLWSYFVAKLDADGNGHYSREELQEAWRELGLLSDDGDRDADNLWNDPVITRVTLPERETLLQANLEDNLQSSQFPTPQQAIYQFVSQDGYALSAISYARRKGSQWPTFHREVGTKPIDYDRTVGWIDWQTCWPEHVRENPVELFKHMAFVERDCGDVLTTFLTSKSGKKGLSAFLPREGTSFPAVSSPIHRNETTPHLPLNPRWEDADFSMKAVARNTGWSEGSRRSFAMLLIQRYAYTIAAGTVTFEMLTNPQDGAVMFDKLLSARVRQGGTALIGINDDVKGQAEKTFGLLKDWMEESWPTKSAALPYEKVPPGRGWESAPVL